MSEIFTNRLKDVMMKAREEAIRLRNNYIATEHLLLGLLKNGTDQDNVAIAFLKRIGMNIEELSSLAERTASITNSVVGIEDVTPFTVMVRNVLDTASYEAQELEHSFIGTGHLLLGLLKKDECKIATILNQRGLDYEKAKKEIVETIESVKE
jgi:ATP-dependent Clp protease ATP-binding subunit ClpC